MAAVWSNRVPAKQLGHGCLRLTAAVARPRLTGRQPERHGFGLGGGQRRLCPLGLANPSGKSRVP